MLGTAESRLPMPIAESAGRLAGRSDHAVLTRAHRTAQARAPPST
jgi:hypothetical protein